MIPPSLRVAIDAHTVGRQATGNETYVRGLLSGLVGISGITPIALTDGDGDLPQAMDGIRADLPHRDPVRRLLRDLSRVGQRWGAELLHVQYVRPPSTDVPVITTVHDISFEHFPDIFTRRTRWRMRLTIPWSARHSRVVLTGSHHARRDLIETYGLKPDAVIVTPYAAEPQFRPLASDAVTAALAGAGLEPGYLLCVGNLQPRKNLRRLLEAYAALPAGIRPRMVVVGQAAWLYHDVYATVRHRGLADSVQFTGFVPAELLVALYNGAAAFAYPSLYEGFGLPLLEALACGVPTLTSNTSSLPEVAGDAAVMVDPTSVDAIADGLVRILGDSELRADLIASGPKQAAQFSWDRCAELTADAYRRAAA